MLTNRERLRHRQNQPAIVALHRALARLTSTVTVMNTGAHPDDEQSGMLALMSFAMGMRVVIACSTRGEGGQNTLGPERTGALGVMRSREMEEAARELGADIAWLGHGPDDPVNDFGFSKSGPDTLERWGKDRTIERLVRAYREYRPDIVIPTFLDVPGQHGHHRAMTEAAETAIALAADPAAYPEHFAEGLTTWSVAKYYLPAWSGGENGYYDDEVPPPPTTVTVSATTIDAPTGAPYDTVGEFSRAFHASQNMGHWRAVPQTDWPLHLKLGGVVENDIRASLPATLGEIATRLSGDAASALGQAQADIDLAVAAYPNGPAITGPLLTARAAIQSARSGLDGAEAASFGHRLDRKLAEIDTALLLAAGLAVTAWVEPVNLAPGAEGVLHVVVEPGSATDVLVRARTAPFISVDGPAAVENLISIPIRAASNAPITNAFLPGYAALGGNGPVSVELEAAIAGRTARISIDLEEAVQIVPANSVELAPDAIIVALPGSGKATSVRVRTDVDLSRVAIAGVDGLNLAQTASGVDVSATAELAAGRYTLPVQIDGEQAYSLTPIAYPHIGRTHFVRPVALEIVALDLTIPKSRIGYVGGGSDRVGLWLERMGADVTELDAAALSGDLSGFDTIVIGTFAFGTRPDLAAATARLHDWVNNGGHLVTLYHRPSDGWSPDSTPPKRLVIGSPSLRWRVTNPNADVDVLLPEHKLLTGPNAIGAEDFANWDKERGLYFASYWDAAYEPLLAMHDAGEKPLTGSLVSAVIGKGRHTHTSLVLHHQLDKLVPGAFRLLANLVQPA
ncbi:PIG-L family deacetylase [Devosia sp. 2618]|uniref:PIG-L family deacetylase n=1 Tax=Devosia sp. 2618 TaxID=3156454 RepID=UPI0033973A66